MGQSTGKDAALDDFTGSDDSDDDDTVRVDNFAELGDDIKSIGDSLLNHIASGGSVRVADDIVLKPEDMTLLSWVFEHLDRAGVELHRESVRRDLVREVGDDAVKHSGGRAGLGFVIESGERVQGDNYDEVRETLHLVELPDDDPNKMSKRAAAERLGCSRRTINRALDRGELYGIDN